MATDFCCGCTAVADYGTSTVSGTGSVLDPITVSLIDPAFIRPLVRIQRMSALTQIPNDTPTAITFDTEIFDTDNLWQPAAPTRLTINTAGLYLIGACGTWQGNATGTREMSFRTNGTTVIESQDSRPDSASALLQSLSYLWFFQPGEYVELVVRQESGGDLYFQTDGGNHSVILWMAYVGKAA